MVYFTGDIHGSPFKLQVFCRYMELTEKDTIVLIHYVTITVKMHPAVLTTANEVCSFERTTISCCIMRQL